MLRAELEHLIAAAADVVAAREIVVIGSQAILGSYPDAPSTLLRSIEADLYPAADPARADRIDGALGDGSAFHRTFGYYAHGVGPETPKAPDGWVRRLVRVPIAPRGAATRSCTALCLEPHDLVLAKCAAGRERDWDFARDALRAGLVDGTKLCERITSMPIDGSAQSFIRSGLASLMEKLGPGEPT